MRCTHTKLEPNQKTKRKSKQIERENKLDLDEWKPQNVGHMQATSLLIHDRLLEVLGILVPWSIDDMFSRWKLLKKEENLSARTRGLLFIEFGALQYPKINNYQIAKV
jgi:hypothetical protein